MTDKLTIALELIDRYQRDIRERGLDNQGLGQGVIYRKMFERLEISPLEPLVPAPGREELVERLERMLEIQLSGAASLARLWLREHCQKATYEGVRGVIYATIIRMVGKGAFAPMPSAAPVADWKSGEAEHG
jgi:hypothetical protein